MLQVPFDKAQINTVKKPVMATVSLLCLKPVNRVFRGVFLRNQIAFTHTRQSPHILSSVPDFAPDIYDKRRCQIGVFPLDSGGDPT
jgi:hypothetical protein